MPTANIHISRGEVAQSCREHHIRRLALFGSVLRPDFRADSDIDVLVCWWSSNRITHLD